MMRGRPGTILLVVALLIALRVLGISALMPVFSLYGLTLTDNTLLIGLAFGGYGLTMALMQIPMGTLSDRFGRKRLILIGLAVYVLGNVLAWSAAEVYGSIHLLIIARLIEGLGAISSVALALLTDVVPEERRTFSLAIAGIGAGVSFLLGVSLGPFIALAIGVPGIFLASALFGVLMMFAVGATVPGGLPPAAIGVDRVGFFKTLADRRALALDLNGFTMNLTLTATMFTLPLVLVANTSGDTGPLSAAGYRVFLLATVLIGGILAVGASRGADKRGVVRGFSVVAAALIGAGAAGLLTLDAVVPLAIIAVLYFGGHAAQSAALPSLVGAFFPGQRRGTAMGGLNTTTYLGSFAGGAVAGLLWDRPWALPALFLLLAATSALSVWALRGPVAEDARQPA